MKSLIAAGAIALSTLFVIPATASADSYRRTIGKCNACGSTLYANRVFVGYNYARQPLYRYIPAAHSCKRSKYDHRDHRDHRGHSHRDHRDHKDHRGYDRHRGHDHHDHDRDRHRGSSRYGNRSGASFWFRIGG